ncbi:MAG TPA: hypothetical protein VKP88_06520, partial [Candidatus Paceibacterota bacterium]|nr:hypothetical protein [Candidatus Paceibacterota bacterium]
AVQVVAIFNKIAGLPTGAVHLLAIFRKLKIAQMVLRQSPRLAHLLQNDVSHCSPLDHLPYVVLRPFASKAHRVTN